MIIISAIVAIGQFIQQSNQTEIKNIEQMREGYYLRYIQDALNRTVIASVASSCDRLDADIIAAENELKNQLSNRGMLLNISHIINGAVVTFSYNITAPNFFSQTSQSFQGTFPDFC